MTNSKSNVSGQIILVLLFNLLGYACNVIANAILTSTLDLAQYGDFSVAWRSLALISSLIIYGSTLSATKFIPVYSSKNEKHKIRGFIRWNFGIVLRASLLMLVVYCLFWGIAYVLHLSHDVGFDKYHLAAFVAVFSPLLALKSIFNNYMLAAGYASLATFMNAVSYYLTKLLVVFLGFYYFLPDAGPNLSAIIFSYLFLLMAVSAITYGFLPDSELINSFLIYKKDNKAKAKLVYHNSEWLSVSQGSVVNSLFITLSATLGIYIVEIFSPNEHLVGLYNICMVAVGFIQLLGASLNKIANPLVAKIGNVSDHEAKSVVAYLNVVNIIRPLIFLSAMVIYYFAAGSIFSFFNFHDHSHASILPLMLFAAWVGNSCMLRSMFLMSHGKQSYCLIVQTLRLLIMAVLGSYLGIYYSIYGIVIADILSRTFRLILLSVQVRKMTKIKFNYLF